MKPFETDAELIADLRALRRAPSAAFAASLDERAAAGFPRRTSPRTSLGEASLPDLAEWVRNLSPRRILFSTGATALAAVAIATAIIAGTGAHNSELQALERHSVQRLEDRAIQALESEAKPGHPKRGFFDHRPTPLLRSGTVGSAGASSAAPEADGGLVYGNFSPAETIVPDAATAPTPPLSNAVAATHRDVERAAQVVLGADPADVGEDSGKVFETVHSFEGVVMRSSTSEGRAGQAGASFDLLIPTAKLADAMAAFSEIDQVRSRHEATADITAPTVAAAERLRDSRARIDGLLAQLSSAETESERELVEAELGSERRHAAALQAQLAKLHKRTSFSHVSLRIETGGPTAPSGSGGWSLGDALHDAGHILAIAAGVVLVALAVLGPIALIALLAWLAQRAWVRRSRRRALG
jgi:Domain of unknown function (DUF4349)